MHGPGVSNTLSLFMYDENMTIPISLAQGALTRSQRSYLSRALKIAERSRVVQRHGAVVVKGGSVLSVGFNRYANDPKLFPVNHFNSDKLPHEERNAISTHAELSALRKLTPEQLRGATVYVARVTPSGAIGSSEPCAACAHELRRVGIKKVIFT
jgi:pyrimidine deaminase RibD-like protein